MEYEHLENDFESQDARLNITTNPIHCIPVEKHFNKAKGEIIKDR